jgi:anhydro-N-acetylmuramic acid kinase
MSGTSCDGIGVAAVRIGRGWIEPVACWNVPYGPRARRDLLRLPQASAKELSRMNFRIGGWLAKAAAALIRKLRRAPDFVASHGHTVLHAPGDRPPHTLQIGEPSMIAQVTGITTVADFRPRDMAAGGQGAPLVPYFDHFVFSGKSPVAMVNIGGIANVTWVERAAGRCLASDLGPGNCMIDEAVRQATRGAREVDEGGQLARMGRLDLPLLQRLHRHPFLRRPLPRSACRTDFIPGFFDDSVGARIRHDPLGVIATLTRFAAEAIARGVRSHPARRVVVSGGGVMNRTLMDHLKDLLFPVPVDSIAEWGWPPLSKEPAAFALLGDRTLRGIDCTLPRATGARLPVPAGKILPGGNFSTLMKRLAR